MERKTKWYVEPKTSHTNKVIQRSLHHPDQVHLKVSLGNRLVTHVVAYEVDHAFITQLKKNKDDLNLEFKVYRRQGENSLAYEFDFSFLKKSKQKKRKNK